MADTSRSGGIVWIVLWLALLAADILGVVWVLNHGLVEEYVNLMGWLPLVPLIALVTAIALKALLEATSRISTMLRR